MSNARHALDCGLCCGLAECDCGADALQRYYPPLPNNEQQPPSGGFLLPDNEPNAEQMPRAAAG